MLAWNACALSLGSSHGSVVLGAPFDMVFDLSPDAGSDAASSCVAAELKVGDNRIDGGRIRITPVSGNGGRGHAVRVQSNQAIDEPVVTVKLTAGCLGQVSRSYTLLSHLPQTLQASAGNSPITVAQLTAASPVNISAPDFVPADSAAGAAPARANAQRPRSAPTRNAAASTAATASTAAASSATAAPTPPAAKRKTPAKPVAKAPAKPAQPSTAAGADKPLAAAAAPGRPRLRMEAVDSLEPLPPGTAAAQAGSTVAAAAGTAPASAAATPGSTAPAEAVPPEQVSAEVQAQRDVHAQELQALQAQIKALQQRDSAERLQILEMRAQLDALQQRSSESGWLVNALLAALAVALGLLAWLFARLRGQQQQHQRAWRDSVQMMEKQPQPPVAAPDTLIDSELPKDSTQPMPLKPRGDSSAHVAPFLQRSGHLQPGVSYDLQEDMDGADFGPDTMPSPLHTGVQPAAAALPPAQAAAPAVAKPAGPVVPPAAELLKARQVIKPEDLFDVQQQADFFVSVGEHQQAIDVLTAHIDAHQDSSPLACLELLHLYYTLSRRDDYEKLRTQFAQHFNVRVPAMPGFTDKGSSLIQGYPEELAQIEALWPTEEVEACLAHFIFRQEAGDAVNKPPAVFDLAAFDDLMLLLALVRTTRPHQRGEASPRSRTTARLVESVPNALPTAGAVSMHDEDAWNRVGGALNFGGKSAAPAATAQTAAADDGHSLEFSLPDSDAVLRLPREREAGMPTAEPTPVPGDAADALSAPLSFDVAQLDFDLNQADLLPSGRARAMPLSAPAVYNHATSMLDIDLTSLGDTGLPSVPNAGTSAQGSDAPAVVGFSDRNLKTPLDLDLAQPHWDMEPPDTLPDYRGLDEPLQRSTDMLMAKDTDPDFQSTGDGSAGEPPAKGGKGRRRKP